MASLSYYTNKFGKRAGRKAYNAYHREYKKKNRARINAERRARRRGAPLKHPYPKHIGPCSECGKVRKLNTKNHCDNCYRRNLGITTPYRFALVRAKRLIKCFQCNERRMRMLDVHHVDGNHSNNSLDNLVYACPNHHRMAHLGLLLVA